MSILPVSPTRMNLTKLKKQLQLSERGHKLLKDKQDELMRQFIAIIKQTQLLRTEVETRYRAIRHQAWLAKSSFDDKQIMEDCLTSNQKPQISIETKNQMGVIVPMMTLTQGQNQEEDFMSLTPALNEAKYQMTQLFPDFLSLAQMEKHCVILSAEIEKTRRRVNALEYMTIPQLKETIRFIRMRLEDAERDRITRLIKMQDYEITAEG